MMNVWATAAVDGVQKVGGRRTGRKNGVRVARDTQQAAKRIIFPRGFKAQSLLL